MDIIAEFLDMLRDDWTEAAAAYGVVEEVAGDADRVAGEAKALMAFGLVAKVLSSGWAVAGEWGPAAGGEGYVFVP